MSEERVPVLVVGGSLVGLTTSVLLASYGIRHVLVERHRGTAIHPRAASFHQRTIEIFRAVGLQREVETAAAREFVQNGAIIAVDSLAGRELACFYRHFNEGVEQLSPTARLFITQIGLEPVLRDRAQQLGAEHCYSTELSAFTQDEEGILAELRPREGGQARTIRARYMVAADGPHSFVRRQLGIDMQGRGSFAQCMTIYFRADLRELIGDRNLSVVYVNQPELRAFFRFSITADAGFLAVFPTFKKDGGRESQSTPDTSPTRCAELIRAALGVDPGFQVVIDNVQPWSATAATAASFRSRNVFLAGDAAHIMPPTGGFGGNTGVADAHNLAWKLAMVLRSEAGAGLLDTYESERRPLCQLIVEQAFARYIERVDPSLPASNLAPTLADATIELGSIYGAGDELLEDPHHPSGRPGTRMPHAAVVRGGAQISTLDLVHSGLVLIAGSQGHAWEQAAEELSARGVSLSVSRIGTAALTDPSGQVERQVGIGAQGALLLRPDGVIGWRAATSGTDTVAQLAAAVRGQLFVN